MELLFLETNIRRLRQMDSDKSKEKGEKPQQSFSEGINPIFRCLGYLVAPLTAASPGSHQCLLAAVTQETWGAEFLTLKMCRKSKSRISQTRTTQQSLADAEEMLETCPFLPSSANQSSRPLQRSRSKPPASSLAVN